MTREKEMHVFVMTKLKPELERWGKFAPRAFARELTIAVSQLILEETERLNSELQDWRDADTYGRVPSAFTQLFDDYQSLHDRIMAARHIMNEVESGERDLLRICCLRAALEGRECSS